MKENPGQTSPREGEEDPFRDVVAVLMAGGAGTRFWPLSTAEKPKQFLTALTGTPLYVQAADRARLLVPWDRILVMTHETFLPLVRKQTPDVPPENVVLEPARRNTAAAIILAAVVISRRWPESTMIVTPSDHLIGNLDGFRRTLARAVARARSGGLGTIGIPPTFPSTDFGYLRLAGPPDPREAARVEQFVEKPDRRRAEEYLASGRFLWNSGIFVWQTRMLLDAAARHLPGVYRPLAALGETVGTPEFAPRARRAFETIESVSVDYGIMEKAGDVWAVPAAFSWSDVGNWLTAAELLPSDDAGNHCRGKVVLDQARGNLVIAESGAPLVVAGIDDCVVVQAASGTLVCHKNCIDRLRSIVERIPADQA